MELTPEFVFFKWPLYSPINITQENFADFKLILTFSQTGGHGSNAVEGNNPLRENKPTTFVGYGHPGGESFDYITQYGGLRGTSIRCVRDGDILTYYFHYNNDSQKFMKVGQYPSVADFQIQDIKKYRKILSNEKLREFSKAIGLAANGVGIGSFVYLRRIFEDLISAAFDIAKSENKIIAEDFRQARMDEKIVLLKNYLPNFLSENKSLYSILSVGIHSLSEEDCLSHFDVVKVGVELILDEKLEHIRKQDKLNEANKQIEAITRTIKLKLKN